MAEKVLHEIPGSIRFTAQRFRNHADTLEGFLAEEEA